MKISIVIPSYNSIELLKQNLPKVIDAIDAYDPKNTELIITDNHSEDNTIEFLNELRKTSPVSLNVIENDKNEGFAVNANRGVKAAKGEFVILLGTDVIPDKQFIEPLIKHFSNEKLFAVGSVNKSDQDENNDILRGRGIAKWQKGFLLHNHGELINDTTLWVDCGSGAFRKSIWDKIGGLQEIYKPFYWEDIDLSYRAQKMGYLTKIEKKSLVIHEHKKGSIKMSEQPDKILQTAYRNQFFFVWLNITDNNLILNHLAYIPYHLLSALVHGNFLFIKGFLSALIKTPQIFSERKKIISKFNIKDKEIIEKFTK